MRARNLLHLVSLIVLVGTGFLFMIQPAGATPTSVPWATHGNAGTDAGDFLGTINNQPLIFKTNNVEGMRLAANGTVTTKGNMGMGVATPQRVLHVGPSTDAYLALTNNDTGHTVADGLLIGIDESSAAAQFINQENADMQFHTNKQNRLTIKNDGNVGLTAGDGSLSSTPVTPIAPAKSKRLFFDDFDSGELVAWSPAAGDWDIRAMSGQAQQYGTLTKIGLTLTGSRQWTDYDVLSRVVIEDDTGNAGLVGRAQGSRHYYELLLGREGDGPRSWFIRRRIDHEWQTLASGTFEYRVGVPYILRFSLKGTLLEGAVAEADGGAFTALGSAVDRTYSGGKIGLASFLTRARFDDVEVIGETLAFPSGPWGPIAELRDNTGRFATGKPAGGWYVAPIHATLRASDGKVLITGFGRKAEADCTSGAAGTMRETGATFLLDPATIENPLVNDTLLVATLDEENDRAGGNPPGPQPTTPQPLKHVLYCAGHNTLADGRIFFSAGTDYRSGLPDSNPQRGLNYSRVYNPASGTFTRIAAAMSGGQTGVTGSVPGEKWYPTNLLLPDGRVLIYGGFHWANGGPGTKANQSFELFDPKRWDANPTANPYTVLTTHAQGSSQVSPTRGYSNLFLLPKPVPAGSAGGFARSVAAAGGFGRVFLYNHEPGPSGSARLTSRTNSLTPNPSTIEKGEGASGVLLPNGTMMFANGGHNGQGAQRMYFYNPYNDAWSTLDTGISRLYGNAVWLPNGTVMVINGYVSEPGNVGDVSNPVGDQRRVQIIDPFTKTVVRTENPWPEPTHRGYHNVALLLKDGRILVGGGKDGNHATGCEKNELRLYEPYYLGVGPRPAITNVAQGKTVTVAGSPLIITYTGTVRATRGVVMMSPGSITHSFDSGQRYVPLKVQSGPGAGSVTVLPPATINEAQPGDYVLYVVSDLGVPSVGVHVRLLPPPPCTYAVNGTGDSYIEAEASSRRAGPFKVKADAARSNGAYIEVTQGSGNHTTVPDEGKVMWYDLDVTNGGSFNVWMLSSGPTTSDDSFWVSIDGTADLRPTPEPPAGWTWTKVGTTSISIPTGKHQLKIKVREDGARVDKILLTKSTATPLGNGPAALTCH